jgi:uncharacterized protein YbjT (DUF2867 family)
MEVVVAGGHGKVALHLERMLVAHGHRARGLIRKPEQAADLERLGAEPVLADIEDEQITDAVAGADAVVFAAGAGPGSGPERKRTVDYGGAVKLIKAAKANGVRRYLMVSALGANHPDRWSEQMRPYYEAKRDADERLVASGLDYTIVRPGSLTDDAGTGLVTISPELVRSGQIPREDVAAVLHSCLHAPSTSKVSFDLIAGETPIDDALRSL